MCRRSTALPAPDRALRPRGCLSRRRRTAARRCRRFFGPLLGVNSQGVKATAIGFVRQRQRDELPATAGVRRRVDRAATIRNNQFNALSPSPAEPSAGTPRRTYAHARKHHQPRVRPANQFRIRIPTPGRSHHPWLARSARSSRRRTPVDYQNDIEGCNGQMHAIGDQVPLMADAGGRWRDAERRPSTSDRPRPAANWDACANRVANSCAPGVRCGQPAADSRRAVRSRRVSSMRRVTNDWTGCPGGTPCVTVSNIIGMFIHVNGARHRYPHGHMVRYPGMNVAPAHQHTTTTRRGSPPRRLSGD